MDYSKVLSAEFNIIPAYVTNIINLLDEGATIPFIARYRKEAHGSLDDQILRELCERLDYLKNLDKRRDEVKNSITTLELMTDEINLSLQNAKTLSEIEDIYRPFKPKRKTRASIAKEKGLQPLADLIFMQDDKNGYPIDMATSYINEEKGVQNEQDALNGAMDIIAEQISDEPTLRKNLRQAFMQNAIVKSIATNSEAVSPYSDYYDFSQAVNKIAGHRVLAINRGEKEEFLKVSIEFPQDKAIYLMRNQFVKKNSKCFETMMTILEDSYTRLIFPSIEREVRSELTTLASDSAIKVFSLNLKDLLMQPPVKGKVTLGLDPGYAHGCKVAVVDQTGKVLDTTVIYPVPPFNKVEQAKATIKKMIISHNVNVIAIGNGTASRETEIFASELISEITQSVSYMVVSEAGASVYSASKIASEEFPDYDLNLRSAISIARRMQDPLAELVKIDPKAIGVGQYQHDLPKKQLDEALGGVVEYCVNSVGVDINTASAPLLTHIAGINSTVSKNIVTYREENGAFTSRAQIKKVPKLGPKAFEQCAGFLRISTGTNPLDNTSVHPESYSVSKELLALFGYKMDDVKNNKLSNLKQKVEESGLSQTAQKLSIGVPTLSDIIDELMKPGRDARDELPPPLLRTDVLSMEDLSVGMTLDGTVRNVIDFGAFVDIGVHQDGLVHISQICDKFIKHPSEALKIGDIVKVKIIALDLQKKRISLTMKL